MSALALLLFTLTVGFWITSRLPKGLPFLSRLSAAWTLGIVATSTFFFCFYPIGKWMEGWIWIPLCGLAGLVFWIWKKSYRSILDVPFDHFELYVGLAPLLVACFFCFFTASYDRTTHLLSVRQNIWSDFAAHVPIIRSFSKGFNFPPVHPLFPGQPMRQYFMFYFFIALLERLGWPLSYAINIPSILSYASLGWLIVDFGKLIGGRSKWVGLGAFALFVFQPTLSWVTFIQDHPFSGMTEFLKNIANVFGFSSFGPYDGRTVTAFWNLSLYANQRHLALGLSAVLLVIAYLDGFYKKLTFLQAVGIGAFAGLLVAFHGPAFLLIYFIAPNLVLRNKTPFKLLISFYAASVLTSLPILAYLSQGPVREPFGVHWHPGYLAGDSIHAFLHHWWMNQGLVWLILPLGILLTPRPQRSLAFYILIPFVIGNLFTFSSEIAGNHKFFNFTAIWINLFCALALVHAYSMKNLFSMVAANLLFCFLILSGLIDTVALLHFQSSDITNAQDEIQWIEKNTPRDSIFLNTSFIYHPANLAGRRIYLGWPYFTWTAGYPTEERLAQLQSALKVRDPREICKISRHSGIRYFALNPRFDDPLLPTDIEFWKAQFPALLDHQTTTGWLFLDLSKKCAEVYTKK